MPETMTINFLGLCTQMVADATSWVGPDAPKLPIRSEAREVPLRVFLANCDLIDEIAEERRPPRHFPTIRIQDASMTDEAKQIPGIRQVKDWWEAPLPRVTLELDGVAKRNGVFTDSFKSLHSVWKLTPPKYGKLVSRDEALNGFPKHAHVYFDLFSGFTVAGIGKDFDVEATMDLVSEPKLIWTSKGDTPDRRVIPLKPGIIEITNKPAPPTICSSNDYLLHYFVTTLKLDVDPPTWPDPPQPSPDVYCSSSGYP